MAEIGIIKIVLDFWVILIYQTEKIKNYWKMAGTSAH